MAESRAPKVRGWKSWLPSLLLLLLVLPLLFWAEISFYNRLSGAGSALELTRPPDYLDSVQLKFLDSASRHDMVGLAFQIVDPANPLGLSEDERRQAREGVARLSRLADEDLWEMHRMVGSLDEDTLRRHRQHLQDEFGTMRMQWARPEVVASILQQRYGHLRDAAAPEEMPAGWTPEADPKVHERWRGSFTGGAVDRVTDVFLVAQVQNLVVFENEGSTLEKDPVRATRFVQSVNRILELAPRLRQEWIDLYHHFVMDHPDRVSAVPLMPRMPDLPFDEFAASLRKAAAAPGPGPAPASPGR